MHYRLCRILAVSLIAIGPAVAEPAVDDDPPIDCENAMSTREMNICGDQAFKKADADLNETYKKALADIPEMATEAPYDAKGWEAALRASQRAWVAFRDAECNDHGAMFWTGGTGATADIIGCMTDKTIARTKELKERYEVE